MGTLFTNTPKALKPGMLHGLHSFSGGYIGDHVGSYYYRDITGDTMSLDYVYGSKELFWPGTVVDVALAPHSKQGSGELKSKGGTMGRGSAF